MSEMGSTGAAAPRGGAARPVRVLVAEDHPIVLMGLRLLLESEPERVTLTGSAGSCSELRSHPALAGSDVLLLDIHLNGENSLELLPELIAEHGIKVIVLTGDSNLRTHEEAVTRGALGIVQKHRPSTHVLEAIARVHGGEVWLEAALMTHLFAARSPGAAPRGAAVDEHARRIATLTAKERAVIAAMVRYPGAKSLVVADALGISEHTLRNRLTFIFNKLRVHGRLNLYLYARQHGLDDGSAMLAEVAPAAPHAARPAPAPAAAAAWPAWR